MIYENKIMRTIMIPVNYICTFRNKYRTIFDNKDIPLKH